RALRGARRWRPASAPVTCARTARALLGWARGGARAVAELLPAAAGAVLLVEYEADPAAEAQYLARALANRLYRLERLALLARVAEDEASCVRFWQVREAVLPGLYGLRGTAQPLAFVEDVGVPPAALPAYLHRVQ